jgi:hypothetical protein
MLSSMRVFVALAVASAVLASGAIAATDSQQAPTVRLERMSPLVVSGTGFGSRSSIRVVVSWKATRLEKTVRTTSGGAFTASFSAALTVYACRASEILAVATNGLRATWRPGSKSCYAIGVPIAPGG